MILRDEGKGVPLESESFLRTNLPMIGFVTKIESRLNNRQVDHEWSIWNTRFSSSEDEIWLSGFNCGYCGSGPQALIRALTELEWNINPDVIFCNDAFIVERKEKKQEKPENE